MPDNSHVARSPGARAALEELCDRYLLASGQVAQLATYAEMLASDALAPTTVRDPAAVRDDHIADSLVALELPSVREAGVIVDIGSGAGVPGVVLAIALPEASVTLLEGSSRKCDFMERAVSALALANVSVVHGRAEAWPAGIGACDLVTARAVGPLDVVEEYAAPLLRVGGHLVVWRGRRDPEAEMHGAQAALVLGLSGSEPIAVHPYKGAEHRHLHVFTKTWETPPRFPRREGVARKRPLGRD